MPLNKETKPVTVSWFRAIKLKDPIKSQGTLEPLCYSQHYENLPKFISVACNWIIINQPFIGFSFENPRTNHIYKYIYIYIQIH